MNIQRGIDIQAERIRDALDLLRAYRMQRNRQRVHELAVFVRNERQALNKLFVQQSRKMVRGVK